MQDRARHNVIAGPGNSQVKHGRTEVRGYGPEIKVIHTREGRLRKDFHLTEPARNSMKEKEKLVNLVEDMVRGIREEYKSSEIVYMGLLPRHVEKCCEEKGHMQREDIVIMHGARREFDKMVRERIGRLVDFVEWFEILGFEQEISVKEVRERKMLGEDEVHLGRRWNRRAVVVAVVEQGGKKLKED
jgi:hypothetical protein